MNLYLVFADVYDGFGCEMYVFGIFSDVEKAKNCIASHREYDCEYEVIPIDENVDCFIGGYTE